MQEGSGCYLIDDRKLLQQAIAALESALGVPVVVAANPALNQGPCTVCGKPWREHGTYPVYESHNYTPAGGVVYGNGNHLTNAP